MSEDQVFGAAGEDLPALAELEEEQESPSARQRAQRRLPLAYRKAWANVITGQVLEIVAQERGQAPPARRHADGRPRGLAALIPDGPASGPPAALSRPRTAAVAPRATAAHIVIERVDPPAPTEVYEVDAGDVTVQDVDGETVITVGMPADVFDDVVAPPAPLAGLSILQAVTTPRAVLPFPDGLAPASERLAHPDAGWCECEGLPGHHRLDVTTLDVHQLDTAQRHWSITAPTGGVLFTLCDQMTPKVRLLTANQPPQRCRTCDTHT